MVIFGYTLRRAFEVRVPVGIDEARAHAKRLLSGLFSDGAFKDDTISLQNSLFGPPWTLFIPAKLSGKLSASGSETVVSGTVGITASKLISIAILESALAVALYMYVSSIVWFVTEMRTPETGEIIIMALSLSILLGLFFWVLAYTVRNARVGSDHLLRELDLVLRGISAGSI